MSSGGYIKDRVTNSKWYVERKDQIDAWCNEKAQRPKPRNLRLERYLREEARQREIRRIEKAVRRLRYPFLSRAKTAARSAQRYQADGYTSDIDLERILDEQNNKCKHCHIDLGFNGCNGDVDHIIPLSRGGSNWPDNIQWLCGSCNGQKYDSTYDEYSNGSTVDLTNKTKRWGAKLTIADVLEIRRDKLSPAKELALKYNVSINQIRLIRKHENWKWLVNPDFKYNGPQLF